MGFDTHNPHQPLDAFAIDSQRDGHATAAEERTIQVQLVELAEQAQVLRALRLRRVVVSRARHAEQFALSLNTQLRMLWIDPSPAVFNR
jgi:plasmid maintenance system killer protein